MGTEQKETVLADGHKDGVPPVVEESSHSMESIDGKNSIDTESRDVLGEGKIIESDGVDMNPTVDESLESSPKKGRSKKNTSSKKLDVQFREHWSLEKVKEALAKGDAFEGKLQISAFHTDRAYVMPLATDPNTKLPPVQVKGFVGRNRALQGDKVVAIYIKDPPKKIKTKEKEDV